ncbi:EAL domain-containing protein [Azonexus sp.]|jgi:diguanylate cyclase (GGDEF)-like protein/PAS domain S-box-containing protein|uniref:putative bifunctional diguanylate cyclase/phosphodiesterase n=1 Tax=Azonexus sp. TaxID=1872668 RepID=UPI00281933F5|nr:EAL domain-containing protein [Azonexus sp.]MDR1994723.1 EAL domain-containing protein [Azonexus sp.]
MSDGKSKGRVGARGDQTVATSMAVPAAFTAAAETAQVGLYIQQEGIFRYVNPFLTRQFGYAADELVGQRGPLDLVLADAESFRLEARGGGGADVYAPACETIARRRDGSMFPVRIVSAPLTIDGRPATTGTVFDLSAQRAAEARIRELADFDSLTGLPNRRLLLDRLLQLVAGAEREETPFALLCLDLDHFKRVNDSLGHSVGDELLCAVARRLGSAVRRVDTLARLGGDEFILAMPGTNAAGAADLARRLLDACNAPFIVAGHDLTVTPSLGVTTYPQDGKDIETLLRNADVAMYKAKEQGRNTFQFYTAEMNTATFERLMLEGSLRRAVRNGELVLHYQPLINLGSGRIIGVEALVRWRHPDLGLVMPDRFIHVAEETGLINPIGDWVLGEACRQAQAWIAAGLPPLVMAVNVAPEQFRQAGFVAAVAGALASSGLDPMLLELEVTERTVMNGAEVNIGTLTALHRMGVELSLDDFGTGYSSLAYLKRFPVGKLKIDRSFVRDLEHDADDQAIASTIVSMGRSLRLAVLAEGVESREQLVLLRAMGCDMAQGYFFSRPLPGEEIIELLRRQPFLLKE